MKKLVLIAILGLFAACGSSGENADTAAELPRKVDLNLVVANGNVEPVDGITPSGQPDEAALRVFADSGYAAVIDLRLPEEDRGIDEKAVVEELGMSYLPLPVGRDDITFEKAAALDELLASVDGPALVHCRSSGRVGALMALRASANGADDDAAIEIGRAAGLPEAMDERLREALASKP